VNADKEFKVLIEKLSSRTKEGMLLWEKIDQKDGFKLKMDSGCIIFSSELRAPGGQVKDVFHIRVYDRKGREAAAYDFPAATERFLAELYGSINDSYCKSVTLQAYVEMTEELDRVRFTNIPELKKSVRNFGLSARAVNSLTAHGIETVSDLLKLKSVDELRSVRNTGRKTVVEIEGFIKKILGDYHLDDRKRENNN
jgi:hypothetical protein